MLGEPARPGSAGALDIRITERDRLCGDWKETGWVCWTEKGEVLRLLCEAAGCSARPTGAGGRAPAGHGGTRRHPFSGAPCGSSLETGHARVEISISNLIF